mmetsp:Transcript_136203/g.435774  ORF Transcript_136203/g.435774 Transcript_136203/m.435774 type:complete len:218 (+) Transcript_136203:163-816(+)
MRDKEKPPTGCRTPTPTSASVRILAGYGAHLRFGHARGAHGGARLIVTESAAHARRHALHGLLDEALHAVEAILLVSFGGFLWPLRHVRGRAAEALDHVDRRDVRRRGFPNLDAPGEADVALPELDAVVKMQETAEGVPTLFRNGGHRLDDDLAAVQAGEAEHVLVGGLVGTIQLSDEEVQHEDDGGYDVEDHGYHHCRIGSDLVVVRSREHAEGYH